MKNYFSAPQVTPSPRKLTSLTGRLLCVVLFFLLGYQGVVGQDLIITPANSSVLDPLPANFTLTVEVSGSPVAIEGATLSLAFDPAVVQVVSVAPLTGFSQIVNPIIDNTSGTLSYSIGLFSGFPSGSFPLASVVFQAIATGNTNISFVTTGSNPTIIASTGNDVLQNTTGAGVAIGPANVPPTVSITAPSDGASFIIGDNVTITASASDSDGTVSSVEFFDGATSLGTDNSAPFEATLTGITSGSHALTAVATDDDSDQTTSATVTITANATTPVVTIDPIVKEVTEGGTLSVPVSIADLDGDNLAVTVTSVSNEPKLLQTVTGDGGGAQVDPFPIDAAGFLTLNNVSNTAGSYSADFDFAPIFSDGGGADGDGSGSYTVTIAVSDGTNNVSASFDVLVTDVHQPIAVSGTTRIEAESFDNQGPPNTTETTTAGTAGIGVEIVGAQTNIGFTNNSDFAEYLIDVPQAGNYNFVFNVSKNSGTANTMNINGGPASISVSNNGSWVVYSNTLPVPVSLAAGPQTLRFDWSGGTGFLFNMDYFEFTPIVNAPPTVSITSPADVTVFAPGSDVTVTVAASDDVAVTQVELFNGATSLGTLVAAPYEFDLLSLAPGVYTLTAVASDAVTTTTSALVTITVNTLPTVAITNPLDGATVTAGDNVTVTADASDFNGGTITGVEFFDGATSLGVDNTAPYEAIITGITAGSHALTAVATDNDGGQATATVVTITALSGEADVVLIPSATTVTGIGTTFTVTVEIQPVSGQPVDGAMLSISYDPALLAVSGFTTPNNPFNLPISGPADDNLNGLITYSGGGTPFPTTNFTVFTIEFTTLAAGTANLAFPGGNIISFSGSDILRNAVGTSITIAEVVPFELCIASGSAGLTAFGKTFIGDPITAPPTGLGFTRVNGKSYVGYNGTIAGTTPGSPEELLFQKEIYGGKTGAVGADPNFSYSIPVDNGLYQVDLYFAEVFHPAAGGRVFDVLLEGNVILDEYDPVNPVKDGLSSNQTTITRTYYVDVTDGAVDVQIGPASVDNGKISGLCVKGLTSANLMPATAIGNLSTDALVAAALPLGISDPENDALTVILNGLPASLSYNSGTQKIEGTPLLGEVGTYPINAIISDGTSSPITEEFLLTIAGDDPPTIDPVPAQAVVEGTTLSVTITVNDDINPAATIQIFDKSIVPGSAPLNKIPFESGGVVNPADYTWTESLVTPGEYELVWNTSLTSGRAYLARITANDGVNLPVTSDFAINIGQTIPALILAKTLSNPLPWYGSSVPGNGLTLAIENNAAQNIGYIDNNDFADYWINVPEAGTYDVRFAAGKGNGGTTTVKLFEDDGSGGFVGYPAGAGLGSFGITNIGWQTYNNFYTQIVFANPGLQRVRLGFNGGINVRDFEFRYANAYVKTQIFLQGPIALNTPVLMNDDLRTTLDGNGDRLVPLTDPYGFNVTIPASLLADNVANPEDNIVDWVRLELRDNTNPAIVVAETVGLVQRDGDVVAADGTDIIRFADPKLAPAPGGIYHLAIFHRNHLAVMTQTAVVPTNPAGTN